MSGEESVLPNRQDRVARGRAKGNKHQERKEWVNKKRDLGYIRKNVNPLLFPGRGVIHKQRCAEKINTREGGNTLGQGGKPANSTSSTSNRTDIPPSEAAKDLPID